MVLVLTTSALAFGGETPDASATTKTEQYNGTSWSEVNDLNTRKEQTQGVGIATAGLTFGGLNPDGPAVTDTTESWNGYVWTEVNDLNTARRDLSGARNSNTAALAFGGFTTANVANNETWNGTNWTEVGDLNTARRSAWWSWNKYSSFSFWWLYYN